MVFVLQRYRSRMQFHKPSCMLAKCMAYIFHLCLLCSSQMHALLITSKKNVSLYAMNAGNVIMRAELKARVSSVTHFHKGSLFTQYLPVALCHPSCVHFQALSMRWPSASAQGLLL